MAAPGRYATACACCGTQLSLPATGAHDPWEAFRRLGWTNPHLPGDALCGHCSRGQHTHIPAPEVPPEAEGGIDTSPTCLRRLCRHHLVRYEGALAEALHAGDTARAQVCEETVLRWLTVVANGYQWDGLPDAVKQEIVDAFEDWEWDHA